MAFYYPHHVNAQLGPSAILPATQFYTDADLAHSNPELPLKGHAGTFTVVHYDLWHRAMANLGEANRYMVKFLFCRMSEPSTPAWNHSQPPWKEDHNQTPPHNLCNFVWQWNQGKKTQSQNVTAPLDITALTSGNQAQRLQAAYALGPNNDRIINQLLETLHQESTTSLENNLASNHTNPSQLFSAVALSAQGEAAVAGLTDTLNSPDWWLRAASAAALGDIGSAAAAAAPALTAVLDDESKWVRRNAAEALGFIGQADAAIPQLAVQLNSDPWPRTRHNAALALGRLGTPTATAIKALRNASKDENYYTSHVASSVLNHLVN